MRLSKERFFFIDNLKILLIVLVILGHLAITYGSPIGFWYYHEGQPGIIESIFYVFLLAAGQSFSMGFFFMMSGYFTPGSYDRKGAWLFLRGRLLRLGAPLLFYVIFIDPSIGYALELSKGFAGSFLDFLSLNIGSYGSLGSGPLWFVEALLIFTGAYVLWRRLAKNTNRESKIPGNKVIVFFALVLGLVTFIIRIWLPIGWNFELLNLQIPFFPQYVAMFVVGIIAHRGNWFLQISKKTGRLWFRIAVALLMLFPVLLVAGSPNGDSTRLAGGFYWQALTYALWEQFFGVAIIIGISVLFREKYNSQGRLAKAMSASAYTAYIFHAPILVFLALSLRGVVLSPLLKFVLVAPLAVTLCFSLSNCIRKLPIARRVL